MASDRRGCGQLLGHDAGRHITNSTTEYLKDHDDAYAKQTDSWKWRQIRLTPNEPDLTFAEQAKKMKTGDEPASPRELVTFLVLHFLTTGERLELDRWRCKDVMPSGRRVIVGPFSPLGLDIGNVSDEWTSPGVCLSVICTPVVRRKLTPSAPSS